MGYWLKNVLLETGVEKDLHGNDKTKTGQFCLYIENGVIERIEPAKSAGCSGTIRDGKGLLMVPGFKEMHCHLDKTLMGSHWLAPIQTASVMERSEFEKVVRPTVDVPMAERAKLLIGKMLQYGSTHIRTHVDIYKEVGASHVSQVLAALQGYDNKLSYEVVAFPQHGLFNGDVASFLRQGLKEGASLVGGVDPTEVDGDMEKSLQTTFELATQAGAGIDYHLHERGATGLKAVNRIVQLTEEAGLQGRVHLSHAFCLRDVEGAQREELVCKLKSAGIGIISHVPITGSVPDLPYYKAQGVDVRLGCDNILDCWSPFGTGDVLERLNRLCELFIMRTEAKLRGSIDFITGGIATLDSQEAMAWPYIGCEATFNLVDASYSAELIARKSPRAAVYYKGNLSWEGERAV